MIPPELRSVEPRPHPHLVILGAGASRAATPEGELYSRTLPLTNDLPGAIDLHAIVGSDEQRLASKDFEAYFDGLVQAGRHEHCTRIQELLYAFFDTIKVADSVTFYDRLVLSLRRKDAIATFNWDPLLPYAYRRHGHLGILPALLFLHGNVRQGQCKVHKRLGWNDDKCDVCGGPMEKVDLLYPVGHKDYSSDPTIAEQWNHLDWFLQASYFVSVIGYSAPATDIDARRRIIGKLGSNSLRDLLQLELIDPNAQELLRTNYKPLLSKTHISECFPPETSWLFRHPRLTCEALFQATLMLKPIMEYRQPDTKDLDALRAWAVEMNTANSAFQKEGRPWQG